MAIRYHIDHYPRLDPRDGAKLQRFSKLQSAIYRDVIGVGSGAFELRSTLAQAELLDPGGEDYFRVVREDTVAATELVIGGFWNNKTRHETATRRNTKRLIVAGAGVMAYLARAVMAPHTYLAQHPDVFLASDPSGDLWRLFEMGPASGGNHLGAALWRVTWEAQHFRIGTTPYQHRHADGVIATDIHADDRLESSIPDLVLGFDGFEDSDGNAWTLPCGDFTAAVGENLLSVVRRLMQAGLYVEMDPDTFELRAWEGNDHRRDRTGASWGANVVRLQVPTDGTIATGNIKSETESERNSHLRRTRVWAGGQDIYGAASGSSDIPWEGFAASDVADVDALEQLASTQITAREEAANSLNPRLKLGADPANGSYRPWEEIRLDDVVTVHTGSGTWDHDEAAFPVAGLKIEKRPGGGWAAYAELGATLDTPIKREFQIEPVAAHSHPPNPQLCRPIFFGEDAAYLWSSWGSNIGDSTLGDTAGNLLTYADIDSGLLLVQVIRATSLDGETPPTVARNGGAAVAMTAVPGSRVTQTTGVPSFPTWGFTETEWYYYVIPAATTQLGIGFVQGTQGTYWGCAIYNDIDPDDPIGSVATAIGASAAPAASLGAGGGLDVSGFGAFSGDALGSIDPTMAAPGTMRVPQGNNNTRFGMGDGDVTAVYGMSHSIPWVASIIRLNGSGSTSGDGRVELIGTSIRAKRCDDTEHYHAAGDPTVDDDATAGFRNGTLWINESNGSMSLLLDNTAGAADWLPVGGGITDHGDLDGLADNDHPQYALAADVAALEASDLTTRWTPVTTWNGDHWIMVVDGDGTPVLTEVAN